MNNLAIEDENSLTLESNQYLTFQVLGRPMAISIDDVKEIIEIGNMTRIPMSNPCISGVINLRGNVVPVIDLGTRLSDHKIDINKRTSIVLVDVNVDGDVQVMGMLVNEVNEILEIESHDLQKTPEFGTDIKPEFIAKMGRCGDCFITVLKLEKVLSVEELGRAQDLGKGRSVISDQELE